MTITKFLATWMYPELIIGIYLGMLLIPEWNPVLFLICLFFLCIMQSIAKSPVFLKSREKEGRKKAYLIVILSYLLCTVILFVIASGSVYFFSSLCLLIGSLVLGVVNNFTKISVHCGSVAIVASMCCVFMFPYGAIALVLVPLIIWGRTAEGFHTRTEAILGSAVGLIIPALIWFFTNAI